MTHIPWGRITAEGAAIVASILLAFWIDAWWESEKRREDELIAMGALLTELKTYRDDLRVNDKIYDAIRVSAVTLLNASLAESRSLDDDEIDLLLYDLSWTINATYFHVPILEAIRNSDTFSEIGDVPFQLMLAELVLGIEGVQNDRERDEAFFDNHWVPYLAANASLPQIYNASRRVPGIPDEEYPVDLYAVTVANARSHRPLLSEVEFQGLLQERANLLADYFTRVPGFHEKLDEVVEHLAREVDE